MVIQERMMIKIPLLSKNLASLIIALCNDRAIFIQQASLFYTFT